MNQTQKKVRRQEEILLSLDKFNFATRKQLQVINKLAGDRNASRILCELEKDKLVSSIRKEQKVYFLSNRGKGRLGSNKGDLGRDKINHTLMRNDLYIHLGMPLDWRNEVSIKLNDETIVCDAMYKAKGEFHFVEIDNQQTMATNIEKIRKYKQLAPIIFQNYKHTPTLIWYTLSPIRKRKLEEICKKEGIKHTVYGNI